MLFWLGSLCADQRRDRYLFLGFEAATQLSSLEFDDKNKAFFGLVNGYCQDFLGSIVLNHPET